jgi:ABC-type glutathione transport system ATPase component
VSETLLSVEGLAVAIGNLEIVSNVDFQLRRGECLGLVGETGSGKSVTCRALTGLLGRIGGRVTRGQLLFDGLDLASISERHWRGLRGRRIGFIPQSSLSGLDPVMTVGRQLVETIRHLRGGRGGRAAALELLDQVQMPHARDALDSCDSA